MMTKESREPSAKGVAIAIIVMTRYFAGRDPELSIFLQRSLEQAQAFGLPACDLEFLQTVVASVTPA